MEEQIKKNQKIVFDYLATNIFVLTKNREIFGDDEIDWYKLSEYLGMEMIEKCGDFLK
jgi:hypothetical protein